MKKRNANEGTAESDGHEKSSLSKPKELFKKPAIPTFALVGTIIGSKSLTTVFGMGTGAPFRYGHRESVIPPVGKYDTCWIGKCTHYSPLVLAMIERKIPMVKYSSVSNGKLNTLPCLHIHPINLVVYQGTFATSSNET